MASLQRNSRTDDRSTGAPIGAARVGSLAGAFQLQLPAFTGAIDDFAQRDRSTISELTGPLAELVSAIVGRVWLHAFDQRVARKDFRERGRFDITLAESENGRDFTGMSEQPRSGDARRQDAGIERARTGRGQRSAAGIAGQLTDERVVEVKRCEPEGGRKIGLFD